MDVLESFSQRFSCRNYLPDPVASELLMKLVDAGRLAPSSRGKQPWEFLVITSVTTLRELGKIIEPSPFVAKAAATIAVFCRADTRCAVEDGAAATENILLAATALGLGTCWIAGHQKEYQAAVERLLRCPAQLKLISLVSVGYPAETCPENRKRRALDEVLHWQGF